MRIRDIPLQECPYFFGCIPLLQISMARQGAPSSPALLPQEKGAKSPLPQELLLIHKLLLAMFTFSRSPLAPLFRRYL